VTEEMCCDSWNGISLFFIALKLALLDCILLFKGYWGLFLRAKLTDHAYEEPSRVSGITPLSHMLSQCGT
jgi:hypothetical protein